MSEYIYTGLCMYVAGVRGRGKRKREEEEGRGRVREDVMKDDGWFLAEQ